MTRDELAVGVVTPHSAPGPELELAAMTGGRVSVVVHQTGSPSRAPARSRTGPPARAELRASTEPAALDRAEAALRVQRLEALAHASTTAGYVLGHREEADLVERLSQRFDVPAVASCAAAAAALRTYGVEQIQLIHPPWFDEEFDELGAAYFRSHGINTVVTKATCVPQDPARVNSQHITNTVEHHLEDRVEAIFLAGNGFRAAQVVEGLEQLTSRLVVEANQALLWAILSATGTDWDITGYGRLLRNIHRSHHHADDGRPSRHLATFCHGGLQRAGASEVRK
jgi:maleate isomerase